MSPGVEGHLPGADTKHSADFDDVAPVLREQPDQLQHFAIGEDGLLPALGISAADPQIVLVGDQERLGLAVFSDGVFLKFLQRQAVLQAGLRHLDPRCECLALLDPRFLTDPLMGQNLLHQLFACLDCS